MSANAIFLANVLCPLLSGIPLLIFAFYFFYAEQGLFRQGSRLLPLFLPSACTFWVARYSSCWGRTPGRSSSIACD